MLDRGWNSLSRRERWFRALRARKPDKKTDMTDSTIDALTEKLDRLIEAVSRLAPPPVPQTDLAAADCFVWQADPGYLEPVRKVNRVDIGLIRGVDRVRDILVDNTERFAAGLPPTTCCCGAPAAWASPRWSRRCMPRSTPRRKSEPPLKLIEIHREDIDTLPKLMGLLKAAPFRFILFCDDLSFDHDDTSYKSLKAALEGGVEGRPANVIFYATSNRRHLLPRDMIDNERSTAINPSEAVEEKVSLSDRFGLWLGFHKCSQDEYLEMVDGYVRLSRADDRRRDATRRGAGMGDDARQPLGPRRLAIHPGPGRPSNMM